MWRRALGIIISLSLVFQPVAYAAERYDTTTKALYHVYFWDECMDGGGRFASGGGNMSGDTVQEKIISYYSGNNSFGVKMTDYAIAGILANIQAESGFNPFRFQSDSPGGAGYGIFQYTPKEKITNILKTDARTSGIFNTYYDVKYSGSWDAEAAVPNGPNIPDDALDAWLEVQLDAQSDPNSSAGEMQRTTVGQFRNAEGGMGLDYISSNLTILEAMNEAKSASDAARIWLWIYERPNNKEATFTGTSGNPGRGPLAEHHLEKVQKTMGTSGSSEGTSGSTLSEANVKDEGKNVTIIGDSITKGAKDAGSFDKKLKNADIRAENSKSMVRDGSGSNGGDSGKTILKDLISKKELRDIVVVALGTNDALTKSDVQDVVDMINADGSHTIVFVTNYGVSAHDYTANNNVFSEIKKTNSNVVIADWAGVAGKDPSKYMADDVHPKVGEGMDLFVETIYSALTSGVTSSQKRQYDEACPEKISESDTDGEGVTFADYKGQRIAFPIAQATKDNISGGGYLSNIPCNHAIGCHYGTGAPAGNAAAAFDICMKDANRCSNDTTVVSITDGTITREIQTVRNGANCNHVRIKSDIDQTVIAYMHLRYETDLNLHVGDHVSAGDVIGHVSNDGLCHDNSTPHVHIDKGTSTVATGGPTESERDPGLTKMINATYEKLPKNEAELASRQNGDSNVRDGGLTLEQAKKFMVQYGENLGNSSSDVVGGALWNYCNGGGSNCVTFSAFFYNKFTKNNRQVFGDGHQVVDALSKDKGVKTGTTPKVWSVFSWSNGGYGHTGVILGRQNGKWIVGHASCSHTGKGKGDGTKDGGGSGFVIESSDINTAVLGNGVTGLKYAYLSSIVDINKVEKYLKDGK